MKAFAILLVILLAPSAGAATYYVDQNHPLASDINTGEKSLPWQTVQHAADTAAAGDTVIVKPGTYDERVVFGSRRDGTAENRITFRAEPRREAMIAQGVEIRNVDYLRIEGFNVHREIDPGQNTWRYMHIVTINADHAEIIGCHITGAGGWGIAANDDGSYPVGARIIGNLIEGVQTGIFAYGNDWLIENNEVKGLKKHVSVADVDYSRFFGRNITFRGNWFHGTQFSEIGSGHVDGFQYYFWGGRAHDVLIEGNIVEGFTQGMMLEGNGTSPSNLFIRNNVFVRGFGVFDGGDRSYGIIAQDIPGIVIHNNAFVNLKSYGVLFEHDQRSNVGSGTTGRVANNIFYNAGSNFDYRARNDGSSVTGQLNLMYLSSRSSAPDPSDVFGIDPIFTDISNLVGADGVPFTADDGWHSVAGEGGIGPPAGVASEPEPEPDPDVPEPEPEPEPTTATLGLCWLEVDEDGNEKHERVTNVEITLLIGE